MIILDGFVSCSTVILCMTSNNVGNFNKGQLFLKLHFKQSVDCNNMAEKCTKLLSSF